MLHFRVVMVERESEWWFNVMVDVHKHAKGIRVYNPLKMSPTLSYIIHVTHRSGNNSVTPMKHVSMDMFLWIFV